MANFELTGKECASFVVETQALEGVKRIAEKVRRDIFLVSGKMPAVVTDCGAAGSQAVLVMTLGESVLAEELAAAGKLDKAAIEGRRECYLFAVTERPCANLERALVICGSDKRGTIYGLFHLSELIGVTPWVYWGDVTPKKRENICFGTEENLVSKEPSVKFRGFFINDEWPCFGNWTFGHFGGFTAEMYDKVFEFLLRMKGNYLWPAMWTSSFALDGPGLANAELADLYGVVIGHSHHEPCLRASEEWDLYKGADTKYGTEWNYYTNREGLLHYWEDGLKRSGRYDNLITIGMRGERDSSMLGEQATLKENIDLLKDIITQQRRLIAKHVNPDLKKVPQLLALYKEVEAYFYGDEKTEGLKDWKELDGVTFMLCEDNFGNMRTLPQKEWRNREGGWGMYYHFDYHGSPVSYEWVDSTPLTKVWEQMTMAYEYGIRDVWIVNVGDLKFEEFPLGYFLELAYDFDKWGTNNPNRTAEYTAEWVKKQFGNFADGPALEEIGWVLEEYVRINGLRRPEALNASIYHPAHHLEADRMLERAEELERRADALLGALPADCRDAYYSMIYFPAAASANLLKMHLFAAKNELYAKQGRNATNAMADRVTACICRDKELAADFAAALGGKWAGMEKAHHIGFTKWNDEDYRYPVRHRIDPADDPRLVVMKKDEVQHHTCGYFTQVMEITDFLSYGNEAVTLEIANGGTGSFAYEVEGSCDWLTVTPTGGEVSDQTEVVLTLHRERIPAASGTVSTDLVIRTDREKVPVRVFAKAIDLSNIPAGTYLADRGVFAIEANHYAGKTDTPAGRYVELADFGKHGAGMKPYPVTEIFAADEAPSLMYQLWVERAGSYTMEIRTAPSSPVTIGGALDVGVRINDGTRAVVHTISEGYLAGNGNSAQWAQGVLDNEHVCKLSVSLKEGLNRIVLSAVDAPLVLERLVIYPEGCAPAESYLGPQESARV